jgi:hypothetical protein
LIGFNADRAISPSGIELFTLRYNSPELAALRLNMKKGEKAPLKYDPQDISVIYVYDRVEDRTIDVPALNQEYTRKLTIWQHHVMTHDADSRAICSCVYGRGRPTCGAPDWVYRSPSAPHIQVCAGREHRRHI